MSVEQLDSSDAFSESPVPSYPVNAAVKIIRTRGCYFYFVLTIKFRQMFTTRVTAATLAGVTVSFSAK